jgi:hypothetical protein
MKTFCQLMKKSFIMNKIEVLISIVFGILIINGLAVANDDVPANSDEEFIWKSEVPDDCPFEQSKDLGTIKFTGRHSDYRCGDTFYPSWASDGNLYSPWTDGTTDGISAYSGRGGGVKAETGHAVMIGDDPVNLVIKNTSPLKIASAKPYQGRYPAGSLVYNGIWRSVQKLESSISCCIPVVVAK